MGQLPRTLLFIDIETTGLKPGARLLELAAILVRAHDLEVVSTFHTYRQCHVGVSEASVWDDKVVEMHSKNGLLADIARTPRVPLDDFGVLNAFKKWLAEVGQPTQSCYIAGSSVHTDLAFLKKIDIPSEGGSTVIPWTLFSHRILDLSTLRTFDQMVNTKLFPEKKADERHRAMSDCMQDLEQLRLARAEALQLVKDAVPF
jgi:oligoribonuclease (3'-5' exoribonuclease)